MELEAAKRKLNETQINNTVDILCVCLRDLNSKPVKWNTSERLAKFV